MDSSDSDDTTVMTSPSGETYHEQDVQHLFRAIRKGKGHLTRFMLAASNNALLNCWDKEGKTPLIECCYIKEEGTRDHMVRILKDAGADVNMKDKNGCTALIHACEQRCNDIVRILVQHCNINPDIADVDGNTALIHSANVGNDVALELLVRNFRRLGLQIDHYNKAGYTAIHVASMSGYLQCAKILALKGKASLTIKDKNHQLTPLEWCLKQGYQKTEVEFLKPSAKFYRLAKLTTTMAKYRKKSTQESLLSSQGSPKPSPQKSSEKSKGKMKGLLKKSKTQSTDETGDQGPKAKCGNSTFFDKFSSGKNESQKKVWSKSTKQRSFSSSDQPDDVQVEGETIKAALTHSRSHPTEGAYGRLMLHPGVISLSDEFGECDTDDLDYSDSDSNIIRFCSPSDVDTSRASSELYAEGGVYCGSNKSSGDDTARTSDCCSPYYAEGGVYCGYTPTSSEASLPYKSQTKSAMESKDRSTPAAVSNAAASLKGSSDSEGDDRSSEDEDEEDTELAAVSVHKMDMAGNFSSPETCLTLLEQSTPMAYNESQKSNQQTIDVRNISTKKDAVCEQKRSDSASPVTEIEILEDLANFSPFNTAADEVNSQPPNQASASERSKPPLISSVSLPSTTTVKGQTSGLAATKSNLHKILQCNLPNVADVTSPVTEIDYLDLSSSPDDTDTAARTRSTDTKTQKVIPRKIGRESITCNRVTYKEMSISPLTEIEYIDSDTIPSPKNSATTKLDVKQTKPQSRDATKIQTGALTVARGSVNKNESNNLQRDAHSPETEIDILNWSSPSPDSRSGTPNDSPRNGVDRRVCPTMTSALSGTDPEVGVVDDGFSGGDARLASPVLTVNSESRVSPMSPAEVSALESRLTPIQLSPLQSGLT